MSHYAHRARGMIALLIILGSLVSSTYFIFSRHATAQSVAHSFQYPVRPAEDYDFVGARNGYVFLDWSREGGAYHPAIDINLKLGDGGLDKDKPVYTSANGTVQYAQNTGGPYGNLILIGHTLPDGTQVCSAYAHLNQIFVSKGQSVSISSSDPIGTIGDSGTGSPHLHWEIRTVCGDEKTWPSGLSPEQVSQRYVDPKKFVDDFNFYTRRNSGLVLFEDTFFRGEKFNANIGFTSLEEEYIDNKTSSVGVPPGLGARVYDRPDGKISIDGTQGSLVLEHSKFDLAGTEFSSGESAVNGISSVFVFVNIQPCTVPVSAASNESANAPGNSCNPQPNPQPGNPGLPPSGGNDTTPPTISSYNVSISGANAYLGVSVSDGGGSGISVVKYSAKVNGTWRGVANVTAAPYSFTWNLCDAGVPNGDIEFGVEAHDNAGNVFFWHEHQPNPHRSKNHNCSSGGGTNPTPDRSCTNLGEWDRSFAYFFNAENCRGDISWFSAHPEDGPGKSGQLSAYVPAGAVLKISSDNWNQGQKGCLTGSVNKLADIGWRNNIEWAQLVYGGSCQTSQPSRKVRFWTKTNFEGSSWTKEVGYSGPPETEILHAIRLDDGNISVYFSDIYGKTDCFDKYRFGNKLEHHNMQDYGEWWHPTWIRIVGQLCIPRAPKITNLDWEGDYKYGKDFTIQYEPRLGSQIIAGELQSTNGSTYSLNQPDSQKSWHLGVLEPGWYWGSIYALSDHGRGYSADISFGVKEPDCLLDEQGVILYDNRHCTGEKVPIVEAGWYSLANFDNRAGSVFVQDGWSVELFDNTSVDDGWFVCAQQSQWDFAVDRYWLEDAPLLNNSVSAVRVWDVPNCGREIPVGGCETVDFEGVALFDGTHCLGEDRTFSEAGFYNLYDFDDRTDSVYVGEGWSVMAWKENTRGGEFVCFHENKWDLSYDPYWNWSPTEPHWDTTLTANDDITSIQVFHDEMCGGPQKPVVFNPNDSGQVTDITDLTIHWQQQYMPGQWAEMWGPNGFFKSSGWLGLPEWHVGTLPAGEYTVRVQSEIFGNHSEWSEVVAFTVETSGEVPEMQISYTAPKPDAPHFIEFQITHCVGDWVQVQFGDGGSVDSPCVGGVAKTDHYYTFNGQPATYTATFNGQPLTVSINATWQEKDCGEKKPETGVVLYDNVNCHGDEKRSFNSPGKYELQDFNDQTSAIMVADGWSAEVFEHSNSTDGRARCVTTDIWDLNAEGYHPDSVLKLEGTVSNIRVYTDPNCGKSLPHWGGCDDNIQFEGIVLFDYIHCGGMELKIEAPGMYELADGFFDNLASSAHLADGWSLRVYQGANGSGASLCVKSSDVDVWEFGTHLYEGTTTNPDNNISSVHVYHDNLCGWTPGQVTKLEAPQNLTPTDTSITEGETITLRWSGAAVQAASAHAVAYEVEFLNSPISIESQTVSEPQLTLPSVAAGSYEWRVRAVAADESAQPSDWTAGQFVALPEEVEEEEEEEQPVLSEQIFLPIVVR